jgi:ribosomal-protein-alanine N-acetyltransferase
VVTGALSVPEQANFRAAGFQVSEHLHLLSHDLGSLPPMLGAGELQRGGRHHRAKVLDLDRVAFDPFWRLDEAGLDEAMAATPHTRFRVIASREGTAVIGYAITGRSGRRGYLQRLAVHPEKQRQGLGTLLVSDALRWLRRWRVERAMVNTQLANDRALGLYEQMGFHREPSGLSVLVRDLSG